MSDLENRRHHRRAMRRQRWRDERDQTDSVWAEAWYRYREAFSVLPSPFMLTAAENEGAIGMGVVRIPALIVYTPIYYALLFSIALIVYPPLLLYTALTHRS